MARGRKPKATQLKVIDGNPGKRAINMDEPEPKRCVPRMPAWLKSFPLAVKEWRREVKILDDMGIMTIAETGALAMRAYLGCQIQELAEDIGVEGRVVTLTQLDKDGEVVTTQERTNPKCVQLKNLITEYRQCGSLLGLDAPSRTKFKVGNPKKKSKAEAFRARKLGKKA